jgi:hypothetical protein
VCFKCGDKYMLTHTCTSHASKLHLMHVECYLSLHAMFGQPQQKGIQLRALVKNQALVHKLHVTTTPLSPLSIRVANGASLRCTSEVKGFEW